MGVALAKDGGRIRQHDHLWHGIRRGVVNRFRRGQVDEIIHEMPDAIGAQPIEVEYLDREVRQLDPFQGDRAAWPVQHHIRALLGEERKEVFGTGARGGHVQFVQLGVEIHDHVIAVAGICDHGARQSDGINKIVVVVAQRVDIGLGRHHIIQAGIRNQKVGTGRLDPQLGRLPGIGLGSRCGGIGQNGQTRIIGRAVIAPEDVGL